VAMGQGLEESALSQAIKGADWVIPLLQSIHIVTIGVVFVSSLMIALRVIGTMRTDEPFPIVWRRFAPWMWYGLVVMVITGVFLVIGEPVREFTALSFWLKMTLLAIAVISTFVFGRTFGPGSRAAASAAVYAGASRDAVAVGGATGATGALNADGATYAGGAAYAGASSAEFSVGAKIAAAAIMLVWLFIIFLGRAIAYDVEVWGSLSLHT
jgi:uncharacterized membrane protein